WLKVQLIGTQSESSGIGSRIEAFVDDHLIVREIYGGSSHASQNSTIAHFGLADYTNLDSLIIKWSSGNTQVLYDVEVNQMLAVTEIINNEPKPVDKSTLLLVPNTFRDELVISYELPRFQAMDITVFDVQGKMVRKLTRAGAGAVGNFTWNVPADIPDGLYFFVLRTDNGYHVAKGIKN
ncbi:MAG: ASPIC/UnbV domain-containing protein, partial [Saprospiraceae bacterium]|nr:ASPIC/UnbV domain-containing protein [Saprospiraceae bacterium]